jgi:tetratricopeptide (TPR) repeat protein
VTDFASWARSTARGAYEKALALEPGNRYALNGLATLLYDGGLHQEAALLWDRLLSLDPKNVKALTAAGNCYRKLRDFWRALDFYREAAWLEKGNFYALYGMADCQRALQDHAASLQTWEAMLVLQPRNRIVLTRAGDACRRIGELGKAEAYYQRAIDVGFDLFAELGLAAIQVVRGRYADAVERLRKLLEREPLSSRVVDELAACYRMDGDGAAAEQVLADFESRGGKPRAGQD